MTWNYRIINHGEHGFTLNEVYYGADGNPESRTDPISFSADADEGPEGIVGSLEMALADARKHPVLNIWDFPDFDDSPEVTAAMLAKALPASEVHGAEIAARLIRKDDGDDPIPVYKLTAHPDDAG